MKTITLKGDIMRHQCAGCGNKFFFKRNLVLHYDMCNLAKVINEGLKKMVVAMDAFLPSVAEATEACRQLGIAMKEYEINQKESNNE